MEITNSLLDGLTTTGILAFVIYWMIGKLDKKLDLLINTQKRTNNHLIHIKTNIKNGNGNGKGNT